MRAKTGSEDPFPMRRGHGDMGALASARRWRRPPGAARMRFRYLCFLGAALLAATQLLLLAPALLSHETSSTRGALRERLQPPPSPPPAAPLAIAAAAAHKIGVDLDARYPVEAEFWSEFSAKNGRNRRKAHWLSELHAAHASASGKIPRRIHQTWKDAAPPRVLFSPRWSQSLRERNAGWQYALWTDADNRNLVATQYPSLLQMYDGYASPIQRADVARYLIAHARGGVYADLDTECFKPFAPLTRGASLLLSYKAGVRSRSPPLSAPLLPIAASLRASH